MIAKLQEIYPVFTVLQFSCVVSVETVTIDCRVDILFCYGPITPSCTACLQQWKGAAKVIMYVCEETRLELGVNQ